MDHNVVVRDKMTERYLLNELDLQARNEFEEHFFECRECAQDVRAASAFVDRSKTLLAETEAPSVVLKPASAPKPSPWLAWLRPMIAAPALALLLLVVGYQNLVTLPQMSKASRPQVLPWTSVSVGVFAGEGNSITVPRDSGFLLFVRIPPDRTYSHYAADLYNPAGKVEWSLTIPAVEGQDQWPLQVPAAKREAGTYTLSLRGITAAGQSSEVGKASFDLQFGK